MCGIYGILNLNGRVQPEPAHLQRMASVTVHRGPDDQGEIFDGPCAMGMRRLSIIDVESGHQPLANEDRTIWVVCNGEIYNFRELREDLKARGHKFSSGSDAEVIVHLYEEFGEGCLQHLRGTFAFSLWDSKRQKLLIARDRLGIKPLYITQQQNRLILKMQGRRLIK